MKRKLSLIILTFIVLFVFASCDFQGFMPADKLLKPPVLSDEQEQMKAAFEASIKGEYTLLYPIESDNGNAFRMFDIDNDGDMECIVAYLDGNIGRVNVIDKVLDEYVSVADLTGFGDGLNFIELLDFDNDGVSEILINWKNKAEDTLDVITVFGGFSKDSLPLGAVKNLFTTDYYLFDFSDVDDDESDELVLVSKNENEKKIARIIDYNSQTQSFSCIAETEINQDASAFLQIISDSFNDTVRYYIDEAVGEGKIATEILLFNKNSEKFLPVFETIDKTVRNEDLLCNDIDGDGFIEIMIQTDFSGGKLIGKAGEKEISLSRVMKIENENLVCISQLIDMGFSYTIDIYDEWLDKVTVNANYDNQSANFYEYHLETDSTGLRLFSIRMTDTDTAPLPLEFELGKDAEHVYYCEISVDGKDFGITEEMIKSAFVMR